MRVKYYLAVLLLCFAFAAAAYNGGERYALSADGSSAISPSDHISAEQLKVYQDRAVINKENLIWARVKDTHSMEPLLNKDATTLELPPSSDSEIKVGDVISYQQGDIIIIHRVIEISNDSEGWYAIAKGDNNIEQDKEKVRFSQIKGILVGVLY